MWKFQEFLNADIAIMLVREGGAATAGGMAAACLPALPCRPTPPCQPIAWLHYQVIIAGAASVWRNLIFKREDMRVFNL